MADAILGDLKEAQRLKAEGAECVTEVSLHVEASWSPPSASKHQGPPPEGLVPTHKTVEPCQRVVDVIVDRETNSPCCPSSVGLTHAYVLGLAAGQVAAGVREIHKCARPSRGVCGGRIGPGLPFGGQGISDSVERASGAARDPRAGLLSQRLAVQVRTTHASLNPPAAHTTRAMWSHTHESDSGGPSHRLLTSHQLQEGAGETPESSTWRRLTQTL